VFTLSCESRARLAQCFGSHQINAVRAVVPNKSNNEITLVLQHFENSVDRAVQAFVEGGAVEILKEWNVTGKKKPKKKKKPKAQTDVPADSSPVELAPDAECEEAVNGFHANGSAAADGDSLDSLSEQLDSASLDTTELDLETAAPEVSEATGGDVGSTSSPAPQPSTNHGARQNHHRTSNKSQAKPVSSSHHPSAPVLSSDTQQGPASRKMGKRFCIGLSSLSASHTTEDEINICVALRLSSSSRFIGCLNKRKVKLV
ncbi:hypothetical protein cypCar_00026754, partial [Cyprinus carpio]